MFLESVGGWSAPIKCVEPKLDRLTTARNLARPEGLEPPAYRFEVCRSIQLSYGRVLSHYSRQWDNRNR